LFALLFSFSSLRRSNPPSLPLKIILKQKAYEIAVRHVCVAAFQRFNNLKDVNKNPTAATVCRYLFTAKSLYMFRVSQHPSSGVLKTVTATFGTGHNTGTATSLQRGLIRPRRREVAVPVL